MSTDNRSGAAQSAHKSHADIIAEMRKYRDLVINGQKYPDRLEAAHKREMDELKKSIGNAAMLREALGKILWCLEWMFNNTDDKSVQSHLIEPIALAKAALAAPPRESITPKSDPDWAEICAKCKDGDIEPKHCEYFGEPNGCNSPIYGKHPTAENSSVVGDVAKLREAVKCLMDNLNIHLMQPSELITVNRAELDGMVMVCEKALSAPPRNCDRYSHNQALQVWASEKK